MCGLVAVISKQKGGFYHNDMKLFTEMLFADQVRGADGTGIIYNKDNEIKTLKAAVASSDFVADASYDKAEAEIIKQGNFVVGHNRAATKGKLTTQNTHPFTEGHITLVHNGTIHDHKQLANVEVDSHAICKSIASRGYEETLKKINGAFALIWVDAKSKTLNFVRNNQRPLYIISTQNLFILSSERGLAHWICERNNINVISTMEVPVGSLFQFKFGEWDRYETRKVDFYSYKPFTTHGGTKMPSQTYSGFKLGSIIKFVATEIEEGQYGVKLLGTYEDSSGLEFNVKYWATNKKEAEKLLSFGYLEGKITHEVYNPSSKSTHLIMSAVERWQEPKSLGAIVKYKTYGELRLTEKEVENLEDRCSWCNGLFNRKLIHLCKVTKKLNGTYSALCPDCTAWDEEGTPYSRNGVY